MKYISAKAEAAAATSRILRATNAFLYFFIGILFIANLRNSFIL